MKLVRIISSILLLLIFADIARYLVYPDVGRLVDENPAKTAFMEYREAEWQREGLTDKKINQKACLQIYNKIKATKMLWILGSGNDGINDTDELTN